MRYFELDVEISKLRCLGRYLWLTAEISDARYLIEDFEILPKCSTNRMIVMMTAAVFLIDLSSILCGFF